MTFDIFSTSPQPGQRFRSLELAATASLDGAALARAMSRTRPTGPEWGPDSVLLFGSDLDESDDPWMRYKWRVWWAPPTLWRDDLTWSNGETTVIIVRADTALAYVSMQRTLYTSERLDATEQRERVLPPDGMHLPTLDQRLAEFPLIRPRLPGSDWELTTVGPELYMGRVAHRVRATRRADSVRTEDPRQSGYWPGVDEYECVVDDALGILLTVIGMVDGVPVASISVEHVSADAPLPAGTFDFAPPPGTRIAHVARKK